MPMGTYKHKPHSEETKRKISESKKGFAPWNKGVKENPKNYKIIVVAALIVLLSGYQIVRALPVVNILGNYAVVGTGITATSSANANLTASGTIAFLGLASAGNPCISIGSNGLLATSTCSGSGFTTTTINGVTATTFTFATSTANTGPIVITTSTNTLTFNLGGRLSDIFSVATTTGNILVANGTTWVGLTVGTNNRALIASSTATNGVAWDLVDISSGTNLTAARSLTLSGDGIDADEETYATEIAFTFLNATTTRDYIRPGGLRAYTITYFYCATDGVNITLGVDERASTTPSTNGTDVFIGGSVVCDSNGFTTTTFANAGIAVEAPLGFEIDVVGNATTSLYGNFYGTFDD